MAKNDFTGIKKIGKKSYQYRICCMIEGRKIDTTCVQDENGNPFTTAKAAKDARDIRLGILKSKIREEIKKQNEGLLLDDCWKEFIENDSNGKAPSTIQKYSSLWEIHVKKEFGFRNVNQITIEDLQNYLSRLYYSEQYSYKYVESFLKLFYLLFGIAYRMEGIIAEKYTRMFLDKGTKLKMPKITQEDQEEYDNLRTYELYEINKIENVFKGGNCYTAFMLGYYLGVRIGECFALRWSDIDWYKKTITIDKTMIYHNNRFCIKGVKTLKSRRVIDMPQILIDYLAPLYRKYCKDLLKEGYRNNEIVYDIRKKKGSQEIVGGDFINRKENGELLTIHSIKYWKNKIKEKTGIEFKYHSLRKTHLTQLAALNTPAVELMNRAGHKKFQTTMKYYINSNSESHNQLINNINLLNTIEPIYEYETIDGEKRLIPQGKFVEMKRILETYPHTYDSKEQYKLK